MNIVTSLTIATSTSTAMRWITSSPNPATPVRNYQNIFFRTKMILMALAAANVWLFHRGIYRRVEEWGDVPVPPRAARLSGYASLVLWSGIIISGRLIAYNWFDCDIQPQPDFVNWAAGCVVP